MSQWECHSLGEYPVLLVGAGFSLAVLNPKLPSTPSLISDTAINHGADFPLILEMYRLSGGIDISLDYVWSHNRSICDDLHFSMERIATAYQARYGGQVPTHPMLELVNAQVNRQDVDDTFKSWVILGVELKRMLALQYDQRRIQLSNSLSVDLIKLVRETENALWVSLNYDSAVETVLDAHGSSSAWRYAFQGLFEIDHWKNTKDARHIVVKPHGGLNIWFQTSNGHKVRFASTTNRLTTCDWNDVGYHPYEEGELRPCIIGYLPDALKDETNSPGKTADASHDFHKWNLAYASLAFQRATSLYILGYSMPLEDQWMRNRLKGLSDKNINVYVASGSHTHSIVAYFQHVGFSNVQPLTKNGCI